jgi:hypothetical protein
MPATGVVLVAVAEPLQLQSGKPSVILSNFVALVSDCTSQYTGPPVAGSIRHEDYQFDCVYRDVEGGRAEVSWSR